MVMLAETLLMVQAGPVNQGIAYGGSITAVFGGIGSMLGAVQGSELVETGGFWLALGGLVSAIGAAAFPYFKAWLEHDLLAVKVRQLERQQARQAELIAILYETIKIDRKWMRRASDRFNEPLPEGFADRPFDRMDWVVALSGYHPSATRALEGETDGGNDAPKDTDVSAGPSNADAQAPDRPGPPAEGR